MFSSVLIANRGEIACRIARTARRLGLRTIAVYSQADAGALHVRLCDEAHAIGPAAAADSYLRIDKLIAVAKAARADCVHPGYGFLSENADFAAACADADIVFVGPPPAAIRAMGLKHHAKELMQKAGVKVVPGFHGDRQDAVFLKQKAYEIGYPVLIKAVAGGGGRGMRRVDRHADFEVELAAAQREATAAFGDARVLIEKYVASPRHIEVQVLRDRRGHTVHLNERDCSLQRRHQKVIEEAPAPGVTSQLRAAIGAAAIAAADAVDYEGAGTVEFIADASTGLSADAFWFMEMNTRLQVEHPVTEALTGLDLVEWQFRIAAGEALAFRQQDVRLQGHAVEVRLYAEDPERGFLPSTGRLVALQLPAPTDVRVETGVEAGDDITQYYDPLIAKVIAYDADREKTLARLAAALESTIVAGPRTNLRFLVALCRSQEFRSGRFDTGFIDRNLAALGAVPHDLDRAAAAAGARALLDREAARIGVMRCAEPEEAPSPWDACDGFQLAGTRRVTLPIVADGEALLAEVDYAGSGPAVTVEGVAAARAAHVFHTGEAVYVLHDGRQTRVELRSLAINAAGDRADGGLVRAPMHGKVLDILVSEGAQIVRGQRLAIIEAMKMEHTLTAPDDGVVVEIAVQKDAQVAEGATVMVIAASADEKSR